MLRLETVKLTGFRRFEEPTNIQLSGKLVAITGPNEAGKTSILRALEDFHRDSPIPLEDRTNFFEGQTSIRLSFFLEKEDLEAADINAPTWFHYTKLANGNYQYTLAPWLPRDLTLRKTCNSALNQLSRSKSAQAILSSEGYPVDGENISKIIEILDQSGKLSEEELKTVGTFADELPVISNDQQHPQYLISLEKNLHQLLDLEKSHNPSFDAFNILKGRIPKILMFSEEDRDIRLPYDIRLYDHQEPARRQKPSRALQEIINISGLNVDALIGAYAAKNTAGTTGLLAAANEKLRELSAGVWSQSDACLYFDLNGPMLDLLVENRSGFDTTNRFTNLRSRSDGYRQFVALHVFSILKDETPSILLIDEVEQHLHYDAQADLVQHLQNDTGIEKVIYTTHSAGALPEDLGTGVRLIQWDKKDPKKSVAINKFWAHDDGAGFRPLLFGMGAATFAFFPTRNALIAEGPSELLLLPRLMREAVEEASLGFQVVHGLANMNPAGLPTMGSNQKGIVFFVDNDAGGKALSKTLERSGVDKERLFSLSNVGAFSTLEDIIEPAVWKKAVNTYIAKYGEKLGVKDHIKTAPSRNRLKSLPKALQKEKISFAYNILDQISDDPDTRILSPRAKIGLRSLVEKISAVLADC